MVSIACIAFLTFSGVARGIDLVPGELRPLQAGSNAFQFSYANILISDIYQDGAALPGDPEIESNLVRLRLAHYLEVGSHPLVLVAQLPMGDIRPGGDLDTISGDSGVGDATFIVGYWPYANKQTETYFATGFYLSLPTGHYSDQRIINLGENRMRAAWQLGYQAPVAESLFWMCVLDATYYQDNTDYGTVSATLAQDPLYSAQLAFRYQWTSQFALSLGYFYTSGGETSIDNINQDNDIQTQRYQLSGFYAFTPANLGVLQYGSDLSTENGFRETRRLLIRYTTIF